MYDLISIQINASFQQRFAYIVIALLISCAFFIIVEQLMIAMLLSAVQGSLLYQQLTKNSKIQRLICKQQNRWQLVTAENQRSAIVQLKQAVVWPWLCGLLFYDVSTKRYYSVAIFPDAITAEEWRILRVVLLMKPITKPVVHK